MIPIPLPYKIGAYVLLALAILWAGRQWLNHHDNKVAQETREQVTEDIRKIKEAEFAADREKLAAEKKLLLDRIDTLDSQLLRLHGSLNEAIKHSKKIEVSIPTTVGSVPDSDLNGTIRRVLTGQFTLVSPGTSLNSRATP